MRETPATKEDWQKVFDLFSEISLGSIFEADADIRSNSFYGYRKRVVVECDDDRCTISSVWLDTGDGRTTWRVEEFIINSCKVCE